MAKKDSFFLKKRHKYCLIKISKKLFFFTDALAEKEHKRHQNSKQKIRFFRFFDIYAL